MLRSLLRRHRLVPFLIVGLLCGLAALSLFPLLSGSIEWLPVSKFFQWRGKKPIHHDISLCAIERWPLSRGEIAQIIQRLREFEAAVIAVDIPFSSEGGSTSGDLAAETGDLAATIDQARNVVLGFAFHERSGPGTSTAPEHLPGTAISSDAIWPSIRQMKSVDVHDRLAERALSQGFVNAPQSLGFVHRAWLALSFDGWYYPSLPLSAVQAFCRAEFLKLEKRTGDASPRLWLPCKKADLDKRTPINGAGSLRINYRTRAAAGTGTTFDTFTARELMDAEAAGPSKSGAGSLKDRIAEHLVFVGFIYPGMDEYQTPFWDSAPGVEIHAHVADTLLTGEYLFDGRRELLVSAAAAAAVGLLTSVLVFYCANKSFALLPALLWLPLCFVGFSKLDTILHVSGPIVAGLLSFTAALLVHEQQQRRRMKELERLRVFSEARIRTDQTFKEWMHGRPAGMIALALVEVAGEPAPSADQATSVRAVTKRQFFEEIGTTMAGFGGYDVGRLGYLFLIAFENPAQALGFALRIDQDVGGGLELRVAIHSGTIQTLDLEPHGDNLRFVFALIREEAGMWVSEDAKSDVDRYDALWDQELSWLRQKPRRLRGFDGRHRFWRVTTKPAAVQPAGLDEPTMTLLAKLRVRGIYDVFLCHNSADKDAVKRIGAELVRRGILPWLDEWELLPGSQWQQELEHEIDNVRAAAIFVGPHGLGPWQENEVRAILDEFTGRRDPVIPVILEGCEGEPDLPLFLKGRHLVDFRKSVPDPFDQLEAGVKGERAFPGEPV